MSKITIRVLEFSINIERPNRPHRRYLVTRRNLTRIADFVTRKQIAGRAAVRPWCSSILGYIASVIVLAPAEQSYWKDRAQALVERQPFNPAAYNIPRFDFAGLPVRRPVATAEEVVALTWSSSR